MKLVLLLWWMNTGHKNACPRDTMLVVGDEIIESASAWRSRMFESYAYKKLLTEYFRQGAKWTAAPKPTMSDDVFVKVKHSYCSFRCKWTGTSCAQFCQTCKAVSDVRWHFSSICKPFLNLTAHYCLHYVFYFYGNEAGIYTVNRKKRGSTFSIITLEQHARFL